MAAAAVAEAVGACAAVTITSKLFEDELPLESLAVHVTVVSPTAKVEPDAGLQMTEGLGSTRSVADAEKLTTAPPGPVAEIVMSAGTVRIGGAVSRTVTLKVFVVELPDASVAVQVTGVVRMKKLEPEGGLQRPSGSGRRCRSRSRCT